MAVMHFLQGTYSGKLGDTVGAGWKGQKTIRTMPISVHDKKSDSQIGVRNGFTVISKIASAVNELWLKTYFANVKKMSPYNLVLKNNKAFFAQKPLDPAVIQLPQSYLGAPTPPSVAPTVSGSTVTLSMPAAAELSQGTVTEYIVAVFQQIISTDDAGVERFSGECMAKKVTASSSAVEVTITLPIVPASGDKLYVYTQAGDGKKTNYSSVATITVS